MVKYCPNCGDELKSHWKICPKCGRKIGKEGGIDIKDSVINRSQIISQHIEKMIVQGETAPTYGKQPSESVPFFESFLSEKEKEKALNASPQEKKEWAEVIVKRWAADEPDRQAEFQRRGVEAVILEELLIGRKLTKRETWDTIHKAMENYLP